MHVECLVLNNLSCLFVFELSVYELTVFNSVILFLTFSITSMIPGNVMLPFSSFSVIKRLSPILKPMEL